MFKKDKNLFFDGFCLQLDEFCSVHGRRQGWDDFCLTLDLKNHQTFQVFYHCVIYEWPVSLPPADWVMKSTDNSMKLWRHIKRLLNFWVSVDFSIKVFRSKFDWSQSILLWQESKCRRFHYTPNLINSRKKNSRSSLNSLALFGIVKNNFEEHAFGVFIWSFSEQSHKAKLFSASNDSKGPQPCEFGSTQKPVREVKAQSLSFAGRHRQKWQAARLRPSKLSNKLHH